MAEIPIQPKRGGSKLPWIIGALALLLVLWLLLGRGDNDDATPAGADTTKTSSVTSEYHPVFAHVVALPNRRS
ncbi:MAG TPA: hypothetical protein VM939_03780 [Gemmatimonadaceae bacterium]|nr:hypothetical protein [Gemmatimonadaceae bacterium]